MPDSTAKSRPLEEEGWKMEQVRGNFVSDIPKLKILSPIDWGCTIGAILLGTGQALYGYYFLPSDGLVPKFLVVTVGVVMVLRAVVLPFEIMEMKLRKSSS